MHDLSSEVSNSHPKISIGVVVYNGIAHIRNALDSIVGQPYKNIELVVVDGGSSDGTQDVLKEYAEHISVLVSEPDKGIYDAMNKACSLASGDWLLFLGCDDVLLDGFSEAAEYLVRTDAVYYGDIILRSRNMVIGGEFSKYRLMNRNICHQTIFYPRAVYKKYSYSLDYKWLADYAYNIRLFAEGIPFVYMGKVVTLFNDKAGSSLGDPAFEKNKMKLIRESFGSGYWLMKLVRNAIERLVRMVIGNKSLGWKW